MAGLIVVIFSHKTFFFSFYFLHPVYTEGFPLDVALQTNGGEGGGMILKWRRKIEWRGAVGQCLGVVGVSNGVARACTPHQAPLAPRHCIISRKSKSEF